MVPTTQDFDKKGQKNWAYWANLVFDQLERAEKRGDKLEVIIQQLEIRLQEKLDGYVKGQNEMQNEVTALKVKAALLGGLVGTAGTVIMNYFIQFFKH